MTLAVLIYTLPGAAAVITAVFAVVMFLGAKDMSKKYYTCQTCGTRFRGKSHEFLLGGYYSSNDKTLHCPCCKKRTLCSVSYDQKEGKQ